MSKSHSTLKLVRCYEERQDRERKMEHTGFGAEAELLHGVSREASARRGQLNRELMAMRVQVMRTAGERVLRTEERVSGIGVWLT